MTAAELQAAILATQKQIANTMSPMRKETCSATWHGSDASCAWQRGATDNAQSCKICYGLVRAV